MIQKGYDYGCNEGENRMSIYRISVSEGDHHSELSIPEVLHFTDNLIHKMAEAKDPNVARILPLPVLYQGTLANLYPDLDTTNHWHENLLERLKQDTIHFGMEQNEPFCQNKVPREGICLRILNDPLTECFKLKTLKFLGKEAELMDKGEVDMEMNDNY